MTAERVPAGALVISLWREGEPPDVQVKAKLAGRHDAESSSSPEEVIVVGVEEIVGTVRRWIEDHLAGVDP